MMTPEERALLNCETPIVSGPARMVGNVPLADLTFRRRRYMGRIFALMQKHGATDAELLYGWIVAMALPEPELKAAARDASLWEDTLDSFFDKNFGGEPSSAVMAEARRIFDHDLTIGSGSTQDPAASKT